VGGWIYDGAGTNDDEAKETRRRNRKPRGRFLI
jgi:hypothetical protein